MARIYSGTYATTILLTNTVQQNPATLTGVIAVNGTNASSDSGFYSNAAFAWSITNLGSISAVGATSYGIALLDGGTIQNGAVGSALGIIRSDETGVLITGAAASITNDGSIIGTLGRGVFLQDGGTLNNAVGTAAITGGFVGVAIYNAGGSLSNAGTITDTGIAGLAVELYAGNVANLAGGQISGVYGVGFVARVATGTLTNAGTIIGTTRDGVELSGGGVVTNTGSIDGGIGGVLALYGAATITNSGVIGGNYAGIDLLAGGVVTNQAGGRVSGGFGVSFGNGTVSGPVGTLTNNGTIVGSVYEGASLADGGVVNNAGSLYGLAAGAASFYGAGTISNTGSISGGFIGVKLNAGGTLINAAGATISGSYGVVLGNGAPSGHAAVPSGLANAGVISATGSFGAELLTNGSFVNQAGGTISGGRYGVYIESVTGTLANYGVISGQLGVYSRAVVAGNNRYTAQVTIINGGTLIGSGGTAVSMFSSNDLLIDKPGAVFSGRVVGGGGRLELAAGGSGTLGTLASALSGFTSITEDVGADWTLAGTLATNATLFDLGMFALNGGAVFLNQGLVRSQNGATGTIALSQNGTLASSGSLSFTIQISFQDATGHLSLTNPLGDSALQSGFAAGSTIYLPNIATAGLTESYVSSGNGGTLTLTQNGVTLANLRFSGGYTTSSFAIGADAHGGSDITIPCFLAGTRLAVAGGERRVERLRVGDRVLTASGALREIVWIGARRVDVARHTAPDSVRPVRVVRDAFGPGLPRRDVLLSPDHAVLHEGVLIPVHLLINRRSVRWQRRAEARYFHVELASHDVLLAEGLEVESFRDTGNRAALGGVGARRGAVPACAPMALGGGAVARARRHLAVQTGARPGRAFITLSVAGAQINPVRQARERMLFLLPPDAMQVTLRAERASALAGVVLDGRLLALDGPCFGAGFAPPSIAGARPLRRFDGVAELALPAAGGRRSLELIVPALSGVA